MYNNTRTYNIIRVARASNGDDGNNYTRRRSVDTA